MEIRKEFKYEMGHIVRNAWSRRCSMNAHGHSYRVEFLFDGSSPDNGQMVTDFGFIKQLLHPFVDSFDHAFWLWDRPEDAHVVEFFKKNFERVITTPVSTTAEMQSILFFAFSELAINYLKDHNLFVNGETPEDIYASGVRVHETTTGYAEYRPGCSDNFPDIRICDIIFSDQIKKEWPADFIELYPKLLEYEATRNNEAHSTCGQKP